MAKDTSFHDYIIHDILGQIPGITSRAMFGGWGIYKNGVIFGIIVEGGLYFKVGDNNRSVFEQMQSHPFMYTGAKGKEVAMSYWLVPEHIFEDREKVYDLIEGSVAAHKHKPNEKN